MPHPGNDPHAAFGKLHRRPVHRPPLGPFQHFLTQPSRTLQGTSVHTVQRRGHQTVLHVSLRGNTNTGESAERRTPLHFGRTQRLDLPGDHCPRLAQRALQPAPCQGLRRALSAPPFPWTPPLARETSPCRPLLSPCPGRQAGHPQAAGHPGALSVTSASRLAVGGQGERTCEQDDPSLSTRPR